MEQYLKERLVGAGVLFVLAVIFIPMFLSDEPVMMKTEVDNNIKAVESKPETTQLPYRSSVVAVEENESLVKEIVEFPEQKNTQTQVVERKAADDAPVKQGSESTLNQKDPTIAQSKAVKTDVGSTQAWVVQLGSFNSEDNAQVLNKRLLKHKFPSFIEPLVQGGKVVYRVRVGPALQKAKIEKLKVDIKKKLKLEGILVKYP